MTGFVVQGHIFGTTEDLNQLKKTEEGVTADQGQYSQNIWSYH